jgi:hypothetical protein
VDVARPAVAGFAGSTRSSPLRGSISRTRSMQSPWGEWQCRCTTTSTVAERGIAPSAGRGPAACPCGT